MASYLTKKGELKNTAKKPITPVDRAILKFWRSIYGYDHHAELAATEKEWMRMRKAMSEIMKGYLL